MRSRRLLRLCARRKSSTWRIIALAPVEIGAKPSKRSSGLSQISRRQLLCRRSISAARPAAGVAIEAVADQEHDGTLAEHAARPGAVELPQAGADPGAARPVLDQLADLRQRQVDVAVAQVARDVGEPGAEQEAVHPVAVVGDARA